MKPLHELLKGKAVNCQTEEEAKEFLSFMYENGYKWMAGNSLIERKYWECDGENTCYCIDEQVKCLTYSDIDSEKGAITYQQFKQLINNEDMETKEVKIQVPEGYEIDKENSTFDCIKFKPIKEVLTYEDVLSELRSNTWGVYTNLPRTFITSSKQSERILATIKLMNTAKCLNSKEKQSENGLCYYIRLDRGAICIDWTNPSVINYGGIHFNSRESAKQAIEILGEGTIKLALSTDW